MTSDDFFLRLARYHGMFEPAEGRLALRCEYVRNRAPALTHYHFVGVGELPAEAAREQLPHRRFAAAGHSYKNDVFRALLYNGSNFVDSSVGDVSSEE